MSDGEGYQAVAASATREPAPPPVELRRPRRSWARTLRWPLLIGAPVLAVLVGLIIYLSGGRYEATDDAYMQAARVDVSTNVPGRVVEIDVRENQPVRAGQVLFRLDPRDFDAAAAQAEAAAAAARLGVRATQATYRQRSADLGAAQATLAYQQRELVRARDLTEAGVSSQAQLDAQSHAVDVAKAQQAVAEQAQANTLASLGGAPDAAADKNPNVQQADAALSRARLAQSYTVVRASQDGVATKVEQLQVGDYVNAATPLFSLVSGRVWVEANFKEDQLTWMRPGQPATVRVDAYPGLVLRGRVQSISPGTGSSFSVLPAENATGNWVKVVQRLPVRLSLDHPPADLPLHAGLSVKARVDTGRVRTLFGAPGPARPAP